MCIRDRGRPSWPGSTASTPCCPATPTAAERHCAMLTPTTSGPPTPASPDLRTPIAGPTAAVTALLRPDLRGRTAYGAPQLEVAVRLNTNENSYPVPTEVVEAMLEALRGQLAGLNRYPDREFTSLREALADYLERQAGIRLDPGQLWAANGSNEVLQHLVQAFGGPGRVALGFTPAY